MQPHFCIFLNHGNHFAEIETKLIPFGGFERSILFHQIFSCLEEVLRNTW